MATGKQVRSAWALIGLRQASCSVNGTAKQAEGRKKRPGIGVMLPMSGTGGRRYGRQ